MIQPSPDPLTSASSHDQEEEISSRNSPALDGSRRSSTSSESLIAPGSYGMQTSVDSADKELKANRKV
jgi:hypothetical protein